MPTAQWRCLTIGNVSAAPAGETRGGTASGAMGRLAAHESRIATPLANGRNEL